MEKKHVAIVVEINHLATWGIVPLAKKDLTSGRNAIITIEENNNQPPVSFLVQKNIGLFPKRETARYI
ncbi:MAG: hypothetical protein IJY86_06995 [Clostridia bacterium]|nr:hypothetical protein [Clostridia bacterium]